MTKSPGLPSKVLLTRRNFLIFAQHEVPSRAKNKKDKKMSEEYKHGEMDISQNQSTWGAFTALVKYSTIGIGVLVFVLTVWLG